MRIDIYCRHIWRIHHCKFSTKDARDEFELQCLRL